MTLKQGDVLIVEAGPEFLSNFKNNRAFSLISEVPKSSPMKRSKMYIALALTVAMVTTQVGFGSCTRLVLHTLVWASVAHSAQQQTRVLSGRLLSQCEPAQSCLLPGWSCCIRVSPSSSAQTLSPDTTPAPLLALQVIGGALSNEFIHLWPCAMAVAGLMLATKCMSADQARESVEWSIYVSLTSWLAALQCTLGSQ